MAQRKTHKPRYRVVKVLDYGPLELHYPVGTVDTLAGWRPEHVGSALAAGLVEIIEEEMTAAEETAPPVESQGGETQWRKL